MTERVAGRELDAEVAEKVMGLEHRECEPYSQYEGWYPVGKFCHVVEDADMQGSRIFAPEGFQSHLPMYSFSIEDAWLVVERLTDSGSGIWIRDLGVRISGNPGDGWCVEFYDTSPLGYVGRDGKNIPPMDIAEVKWVYSLPLAICLAALAVLSVSQGPQGGVTG